ncbi:MAG: InlB B-repeat-containing protein [Ruminococcus sp.]|nr:InlB B-repeat-containing protein [Ruminococcus sp.]
MNKKKTLLSFITAAALTASFAITVNAAEDQPLVTCVSGETAVNSLLSEGMTADNITSSFASEEQIAIFSVPEDMGLPFNDGVVLSTGYTDKLFNSSLASGNLGGKGDDELTAMYQSEGYTGDTNDAVKLSFDIVPTTSSLSFDFFFASTEYNQNARYNDVFALWIIDSETGEKFNVAHTPFGKIVNVQNTVTKDSQGNVKYTESSKYYNAVNNHNINGYNFGVQGFTTMFTADASSLKNSLGNSVIQPGKVVTVSFAIADCGDYIRDSAIFIRSKSINFVPSEKKKYTVTFDANGGICDVKSAVTGTDGTLEILPEASYENHIFDGWYTKASGGDKVDVTTVFSEDTTLYAHWIAESYTIKFDTDGGKEIADMVYTSDDSYTIPAAEKDGYEFAGWSVVSGDGNWNIDENIVSGTSVNGMYGNLSLKANWTEIPTTEPTTVEPTTIAPSEDATSATGVAVSTKDTATPDQKKTDNSNGVIQTGIVFPTSVTLIVLISGLAVVYFLHRKEII